MLQSAARQGPASFNWRGGIYMDAGYRALHIPTLPVARRQLARKMVSAGDYVREHRLVMAEHVGRALKRNEQVHHRNGIKTDNQIENLELHDGSTHAAGHRAMVVENKRLRASLDHSMKRIEQMEQQLAHVV